MIAGITQVFSSNNHQIYPLSKDKSMRKSTKRLYLRCTFMSHITLAIFLFACFKVISAVDTAYFWHSRCINNFNYADKLRCSNSSSSTSALWSMSQKTFWVLGSGDHLIQVTVFVIRRNVPGNWRCWTFGMKIQMMTLAPRSNDIY